jgi:hypothetical protein
MTNYCHRGIRPEKNGLLDNRNRVHPCARRSVWNDEKNDPTNDPTNGPMNGPMNDEKTHDFGVIHCGAIGGCDVRVLRASSF